MSTGAVHVGRPGLQTTVQDLGRWGFQSQGVPVAGPMDPFSHRLANALVGNPRSAATLEVTLVGPELEFEDERFVAIAGADFVVTVDNTVAPHARLFVVSPGSVVRFGSRTQGCRGYLAVDGGFDVPPVLGSRATHVASGMGGWQGRPLIRGDRVPLGQRSHPVRVPRRSAPVRSPIVSTVVRALPGPERDRFTADALDALQSAPYTVAGDSDRMGFRLAGPSIQHTRGADIISDATPFGSLQVPGSGQPVLLMADRQTTGGYPKVATVISADIGLAGQAGPGDSLTFRVYARQRADRADRLRASTLGSRGLVSDFWAGLVDAFGADRVRRGVHLSGYTTFRVGGAADLFLETRGSDEIVQALQLAHAAHVPVTVLGGGSNVLVSDSGVRGLVIRPRGGEVCRIDDRLVRADAAVTINGLVRWTIMHGAAGLEAWAGTPGTVGGAIFGNAHFGGRLIGELVERVRLANRAGGQRTIPAAAMSFGYDRSRLQETGEVLLSAAFRVSAGDPAYLRAAARESLAFRKRTQPLDTPSAGCIFQNPTRGRDEVPEGMPWSAGALVDRAGLKGTRVGGASVSTTHGNFIVNDGSACARDIRQLIEYCRRMVHDRFGVDLRDEIVYLGEFDDNAADRSYVDPVD